MSLFYAKSTGGFYNSAIHAPAQIPSDAVQISRETYASLIEAQSAGKVIRAKGDGTPEAVDYISTLTAEETMARKLSALAAYRYEKETGGITVNGVGIDTDRESQAMLNGAMTFFAWNPTALIDWKGINGWVQVDKDTLEAVAKVVAAHVQACFSNEKAHAAAIRALTTKETIEAYDYTTGWPATA
jgi:hypothetical protein